MSSTLPNTSNSNCLKFIAAKNPTNNRSLFQYMTHSINLRCLTLVAAVNYDVIHVLLISYFQGIDEISIHIAGLVHHNVKQLFSCLDWLAVFGLNGLQLFQCKRVRLKHVARDALGVEFLRHILVYATQHISVICISVKEQFCVSLSLTVSRLSEASYSSQLCSHRTQFDFQQLASGLSEGGQPLTCVLNPRLPTTLMQSCMRIAFTD